MNLDRWGAVPQAETEFSWTIAPNPNNGQFKLNLGAIESEPLNILITDITGRIVHRQQVENISLNISIETENLIPGMYFISVDSEQVKSTKRMIIQR